MKPDSIPCIRTCTAGSATSTTRKVPYCPTFSDAVKSKNWGAGLLFCERTPPPCFRHQHLTYMPAAPPLPAHFLQPREASKTLREIGVITVDVPASRSNSQTQIFMNLFISSKCVPVFIGYRTPGKSVLIAPFCKYEQFLLYYYGIIFQSLCEALYLIRD